MRYYSTHFTDQELKRDQSLAHTLNSGVGLGGLNEFNVCEVLQDCAYHVLSIQ